MIDLKLSTSLSLTAVLLISAAPAFSQETDVPEGCSALAGTTISPETLDLPTGGATIDMAE